MDSASNGRPTRPRSRVARAIPSDAIELQEQVEQLMADLRLAVIFGGDKISPGSVVYQSSNTRPWKSYEAVAHDIAGSLERIGFRNIQLMPDDMRLGDRIRREGIHMAWLNSGGVQGYNSAAHGPAMLELFGIPYVGHDPLTASTLDNKHAFKREAICADLPTAPFSTWHSARGPFRPDVNSRFQRAFADYPGPFVIKPVSGRASLHVHVAEDRESLPDMVDEVYRATENVVLIEKYLPGREFCIAVAGPVTARRGRLVRGREPFAFAALERVLASDEKIFTSMDVKPITKDRYRALDPQHDSEQLGLMRRLACEVFLEFNLSSLVRLDMRADENGALNILEANPKPDLKRPAEGITNLISAGLPECGMDYDDLILSLLADRLDFLFTHRGESVRHILDLFDRRSSGGPRRRLHGAATTLADGPATSARATGVPASAQEHIAGWAIEDAPAPDVHALVAGVQKIGRAMALINEIAAELNVLALNATIEAARAAEARKDIEAIGPSETRPAGGAAASSRAAGRRARLVS